MCCLPHAQDLSLPPSHPNLHAPNASPQPYPLTPLSSVVWRRPTFRIPCKSHPWAVRGYPVGRQPRVSTDTKNRNFDTVVFIA